MTSNRLGAALAVALFANQREDGGYDLDAAGEHFAESLAHVRLQGRMREVVEKICQKHGVSVDYLREPDRHRERVMIRDEAIWELRRLAPPASYSEAGRAVGLTNHASAITAERRHKARLRAQKRSEPSPKPSMAGAGGVVPTTDALPPSAARAGIDLERLSACTCGWTAEARRLESRALRAPRP